MQINNAISTFAATTAGIDPSVQAAIATGVFAVIGTYLTVKYKDRIVKKADRPKDRMETIFDGYENLIKQQQIEIGRKGQVITSLEGVVQRLEEELKVTRTLLDAARDELKMAEKHNRELRVQLDGMKTEYNKQSTKGV